MLTRYFVVAGVSSLVAFYGGYKLAAGNCASAQLEQVQGALVQQEQVIQAVESAVTQQETDTLQVAKQEAKTTARHKQETLTYETYVQNRADCSHNPDAFRLLTESIDRANSASSTPIAGLMSDALPGVAEANRPYRGGIRSLGIIDGALGGDLQDPSQRLRDQAATGLKLASMYAETY